MRIFHHNASDWKNDGELTHDRDDYVDFVRGKTLIVSGDRKYRAIVLAGITGDGKTIFHDVEDVYPDSFEIKNTESPTTVSANELPNSILEDSVSPKVAQDLEKVKEQFSLSDSDGNQLSDAQAEFFKDSVVRDESGNLKVMYHGTSKGGFNVFDTYGGNHGLFGVGSYFTDSKTIGESYTKKGKGSNPQVYEAYLNIKNPIDMDAQADVAEWQNAFEDVDFPESGTNEQMYRAVEEFYADQYMSKWEVADIIQSTLEVDMGYDGITHIGGNRVNPNGEQHRVYIAFNPEQIKRTDNQNPTTDADIRYSISEETDTSFTPAEIQTIQSIGQNTINNFTPQDISATAKLAKRYWEEMWTKSPFYRVWFGDWRASDSSPVKVATKQGDTRVGHINKDTGWAIQNSGKVHSETKALQSFTHLEAVPYLPYIDEIIENAVLLNTEGLRKPKSENSLLMHYLYAVADIGSGPEVLKLAVEEMYNPGIKGTNKRAYALQNIEKAFAASGMVQGNSPSHGTNTANAVNTVADLFALVKRMDKNFSPDASSKIVNADGTPKVMYHGSPAQFTIFDKSKAKSGGHYGRGFYFTDSTSHAGTYGNLYSVYLNIRNPLQSGGEAVSRSQVRKYLEAVAENEDYSIENYGTYDVDAVLDIVMGQAKTADAFQIIQDISATAIGDMVEAAELFNRVNGTEFDGIVAPTETVAFYPGQIKSATDNIGTFDKNNPDIRFSLSDAGDAQRSGTGYGVYGDKIGIRTSLDPFADFAPIGENVVPVAKNVQPGRKKAMDSIPATAEDAENAQGIYSISDEDAPPVMEAPMPESEPTAPHDPFAEKNIDDVSKRNVHAYMYDHPEVKPYFQQEANIMLGELRDTVKGERIYNEEGGWTGTSRHTSEDIAYLRDALGYSYADIEKGLNAIIEDNGKYDFLTSNGISYREFKDFDDDTKDAYSWAFENQEKYRMAETLYGDFPTYYQRKKDLDAFDAKDEYGNTVNGLKKQRVFDYIEGLQLDAGEKMIMFKSYYPKDDTYNYEIIDYLNNRDDISYEEMNEILIALGFKIEADGVTITWD